jgi:cytochrome c oxidase assembly protein subunit 15
MSPTVTKDDKNYTPVIIWLGVVCAMVALMIVVGGITRLTESGLSMVDWRPIMGTLPPLSDTEWQSVFQAYQQFPEYKLNNQHMTLEGFKTIFYWEYGHRVLGRLIGLAYFLPFMAFLLLGKVRGTLRIKLVVGLVLGGLQGLMGWYMVKSGLVDIPRVSHYRLAAHLLLAMLILAYLYWLILEIQQKTVNFVNSRLFSNLMYAFTGVLVLQILYGAFTAGSRAGYGYNTFPLMNGSLIAEAVFYLDPWWINLFESTATIQFLHRWFGALLFIFAGLVYLVSLANIELRVVRKYTSVLMGVVIAQFLLGVLTLINIVPIGLASLHQFGACVLLVVTVRLLYLVRSSQHEPGV